MNIFGFDPEDSQENCSQGIRDLKQELENSGCFDGKFFIGSFQIGEMIFLPLTLGGFLELQVRNHPALSGNWPHDENDHLAKSCELFSILCGAPHTADQVKRLLSARTCMRALDLGKTIVASALGCAMEIKAALAESPSTIPFSWWGEAVAVLVRVCGMRTRDAMSMPITPGFTELVISSIKNKGKFHG
ncbi:MAG: hypothetical protein ACOYM3_16905 [Terrimicrobiaceae bacterium]